MALVTNEGGSQLAEGAKELGFSVFCQEHWIQNQSCWMYEFNVCAFGCRSIWKHTLFSELWKLKTEGLELENEVKESEKFEFEIFIELDFGESPKTTLSP